MTRLLILAGVTLILLFDAWVLHRFWREDRRQMRRKQIVDDYDRRQMRRKQIVDDYILLRLRAEASNEMLWRAMMPSVMNAGWSFEDVVAAAERKLPGISDEHYPQALHQYWGEDQ